MKYLCVGGPWDRKYVELQRGQQSLVLPSSEPLRFDIAWGKNVPDGAVTIDHHTYKVVTIGYAMPGFDATAKVLAYFGRAAQDRPENFYL